MNHDGVLRWVDVQALNGVPAQLREGGTEAGMTGFHVLLMRFLTFATWWAVRLRRIVPTWCLRLLSLWAFDCSETTLNRAH